MPRRNWRVYGGRKESGGFEIGVEVTSEVLPFSFVQAEKAMAVKQKDPFKGVKNIPQKLEDCARAVAVVLINDIKGLLPRESVNIDSEIEMECQGLSVHAAVDTLKESKITSLQAAKFAWNTLRVAGQNIDPTHKQHLIQVSKQRFGEKEEE